MGGTPCFAGTRVPVQTLLDYLEAGDSIDDFLDGFPTVKREQVIQFLEAATERLVAAARCRSGVGPRSPQSFQAHVGPEPRVQRGELEHAQRVSRGRQRQRDVCGEQQPGIGGGV
jgi:uncharacterized protein (DUF433 family)